MLPSITQLPKGNYVIAVSGGVDSVVLLDMLANSAYTRESRFVIAHFDHGIREDSASDAEFVRQLALKYRMPIEVTSGNLGAGASEEAARNARHGFFDEVCTRHSAVLVTAHHQDDLLETAVFNMLRGTGPHGVVSMLQNAKIVRPLIAFTKHNILHYAKMHELAWREDSTNADDSYRRNYIRHHIMPCLEPVRMKLLMHILLINSAVTGIDALTAENVQRDQTGDWMVERSALVSCTFKESTYLLRELFRRGQAAFDETVLVRATVFARTAPVHARFSLGKDTFLVSGKKIVKITKSTG